MTENMKTHLKNCLRQLQLASFAANFAQQAALAANEGWSYDNYLLQLCQLEL